MNVFQSWTLLVSLIVSILVLKDRFALLFLVILLIANLKGMLLLFKRNLSGKELVKALTPNRSIQLLEGDLDTAIEQVRFHLAAEPEAYFLVVMPEVAIFHQERSLYYRYSDRTGFIAWKQMKTGLNSVPFPLKFHFYSRRSNLNWP